MPSKLALADGMSGVVRAAVSAALFFSPPSATLRGSVGRRGSPCSSSSSSRSLGLLATAGISRSGFDVLSCLYDLPWETPLPTATGAAAASAAFGVPSAPAGAGALGPPEPGDCCANIATANAATTSKATKTTGRRPLPTFELTHISLGNRMSPHSFVSQPRRSIYGWIGLRPSVCRDAPLISGRGRHLGPRRSGRDEWQVGR